MTGSWSLAWSAPGERLLVQRLEVDGRDVHRVVSNGAGEGAVVVVRDGPRILFVEVERPAVGRVLVELPRGQAERGDADPVETAARELREETGHRLAGGLDLGVVWAESGLCGDAVHVVAGSASPAPGCEAEYPVQHWLDETEISAAVLAGRIRDGLTLAALAVERARPRGL